MVDQQETVQQPQSSKGRKIVVGFLSVLAVVLLGVIFWVEKSVKLKKEIRLPEVFVQEGESWWNDGWGYRKPINITSSVDSNDYQIKVVVDTKALIDSGKMKSDCADLRFTQGTEELAYWIEKGCNTNQTIIWVKAKEIKTSGSKIYLYYGNNNASTKSNGSGAFIFFDDFESGNLGKWSQTGDWTANQNFPAYAGQYSASTGGKVARLIKNFSQMDKATVELNVKFGETDVYHYPLFSVGAHTSSGGDYILATKPDGHFAYWPGSWPYRNLPKDTTYQAGTWYKLMVKLDKAGESYEVFIDGDSKGKPDPGQFRKDHKIVKIDILNTSSDPATNGNMRIDNVFVRQFASFGSEPCSNGDCSSGVGSEETKPSPTSTPTPTPIPTPGPDTGQFKVKVGFLGRSDNDWKEKVEVCLKEKSSCQEVQLDTNGLSSQLSFDGITSGQTYTIQVKRKTYLSVVKQQALNSGDNGTIDMGKMPSGDLDANNQINSLDWSIMKLNFGKDGE